MPAPMKLQLGPDAVARIAARVTGAWPAFPAARFVALAHEGLDDKELLDRARHLGEALSATLPAAEDEALRVLIAALDGPMGFDGLVWSAWLSTHGFEHFDLAMELQRELTRRFSSEFCIRPYLDRFPDRTIDVLARWADDPDVHVRRLVSEGTRPRLPWAPRLRRYDADAVLPLLARLRDDPEEYVRRSVANHLNDLGREDRARLVAVARDWSADAPPARRKLLAHALRSLVKAGDADALALVGVAGDVRATATVPDRAAVGETLRVVVEVENAGAAEVRAVVDVVVDFVKARGTGAKVFKGWTGTLAPGARRRFTVAVSLKVHTTRVPRPGWHAVALRVNGRTEPVGGFELG